jgi:hypothetical protein
MIRIARALVHGALAATAMGATAPGRAAAQGEGLPAHLRDRGRGQPTSLFGTYITRGQLIVFPYVARTIDRNLEYQPSEFGYGQNDDVRGRYQSTQAQLYVSYGLTDWLAVEVESSRIRARLDKSPDDTSGLPARIDETGLADIEAQLRLRLARERGRRPEIFASVEVLPPQQRDKLLIGDAQWNFKGGLGLIRGYSWGTLTFRTTIEYNRGDKHWDLGETSLEFLRQLSSATRLFLAIEGGEGGALDDYTFVSGVRWRLGRGLYFKFDNVIGLMSKATDWESQVGVLFELH